MLPSDIELPKWWLGVLPATFVPYDRRSPESNTHSVRVIIVEREEASPWAEVELSVMMSPNLVIFTSLLQCTTKTTTKDDNLLHYSTEEETK